MVLLDGDEQGDGKEQHRTDLLPIWPECWGLPLGLDPYLHHRGKGQVGWVLWLPGWGKEWVSYLCNLGREWGAGFVPAYLVWARLFWCRSWFPIYLARIALMDKEGPLSNWPGSWQVDVGLLPSWLSEVWCEFLPTWSDVWVGGGAGSLLTSSGCREYGYSASYGFTNCNKLPSLVPCAWLLNQQRHSFPLNVPFCRKYYRVNEVEGAHLE